ncbi:hypothetical protein lerEdw1_010427 [Lerista edwardsae]|nr:hypothetical protein lerEdw1_010427 [Lerista edwardsae]
MTNVSRIVLLFSILIRPNVCQGRRPAKQEDAVERPRERGLLVAVLCVFLLLLFLLVAGFFIIQCALMSQTICDEDEAAAIQECDDSEWAQAPEEEEEELEPLSVDPSDAKPTQVSISRLYRRQSSERFHCDESGAAYELEDFQSFTGSSLSISEDPPDSRGSQGEDLGGGHSSDSTLLFEICHEM